MVRVARCRRRKRPGPSLKVLLSEVVTAALLVGCSSEGPPLESSAATSDRHSFDTELVQAARLGAEYVAQEVLADPDDAAAGEPIDTERSAAETRRNKILRELEDLGDHEWAGIYTCGDGLGMNVAIYVAPKGGFTYTWDGCMGLYDVNHGDILEARDGLLRVDLAVDADQNWHWYQAGRRRPYMAASLFLVRWGTRLYLLPESQLIPFCNDFNDGLSMRYANYPCREMAGTKKVASLLGGGELPEGRPQLPAPFRRFLLGEPIEAWIVEAETPVVVEDDGSGDELYQVEAVVDAGLDSGLLPGMIVFPTLEGIRGPDGVVVEVFEHRSRVVFRFQMWPAPQTGWLVSTRDPSADFDWGSAEF